KSGPSSSPVKTLCWLCVCVLLGHIVGSYLIVIVVKDMFRKSPPRLDVGGGGPRPLGGWGVGLQ
ncbi:jg3021, partial [Pararge aegeria aegeria]